MFPKQNLVYESYLTETMVDGLPRARSSPQTQTYTHAQRHMQTHTHTQRRTHALKKTNKHTRNHAHMVRSTLLHLRLRGSLRALLGGPPATVFFRLQPKVFMIQMGSRNKTFFFPRASNHEESDFLMIFLWDHGIY